MENGTPKILTKDHAIKKFLKASHLQSITFVKPSPGNGVLQLFTHDTRDSMATRRTVVAEVSLAAHQATPVHVRFEAEKFIQVISGSADLVIWSGDKATTYALIQGLTCGVIVPPGCPHAVFTSGTHLRMLVISSGPSEGDVEWEVATEELLRNEHLNVHTPVLAAEPAPAA
jgi:uncharacterized RmlC-like cupin family protein